MFFEKLHDLEIKELTSEQNYQVLFIPNNQYHPPVSHQEAKQIPNLDETLFQEPIPVGLQFCNHKGFRKQLNLKQQGTFFLYNSK